LASGDVATKISDDVDTIFALHSMTKPITSVAAMMLIDAGKLSLADPVPGSFRTLPTSR
jgi:CubicO group peptidase (beta-lactamase class C family)